MPRLIGAAQAVTLTDKVNTFNTSGTFTSSPLTTTVDYLVVAGGGAGNTGGGGAGGFRTGSSFPVSSSTAYPITIGGGAAGAPMEPGEGGGRGSAGTPSVFSSITSAGVAVEVVQVHIILVNKLVALEVQAEEMDFFTLNQQSEQVIHLQ